MDALISGGGPREVVLGPEGQQREGEGPGGDGEELEEGGVDEEEGGAVVEEEEEAEGDAEDMSEYVPLPLSKASISRVCDGVTG